MQVACKTRKRNMLGTKKPLLLAPGDHFESDSILNTADIPHVTISRTSKLVLGQRQNFKVRTSSSPTPGANVIGIVTKVSQQSIHAMINSSLDAEIPITCLTHSQRNVRVGSAIQATVQSVSSKKVLLTFDVNEKGVANGVLHKGRVFSFRQQVSMGCRCKRWKMQARMKATCPTDIVLSLNQQMWLRTTQRRKTRDVHTLLLECM